MNDHRPDIPTPAVRRLSLYLRELEGLSAQNTQTVSSSTLGDLLGLTDAQVRKDLAYFGQFGRPGVGYQVSEMIEKIRQILGTDKVSPALIVGLGNIGMALAMFEGFRPKGFDILALFDADPEKIGRVVNGLTIHSMDELAETVERKQIKLGIMAVPGSVAKDVAKELISVGIRGILNFAPASLDVPDDITVRSLDVAAEMEQLSFKVQWSD